jgi:signal transduction histidine kinase
VVWRLTTGQWFAVTLVTIGLLLAGGTVLGVRALEHTGEVTDRLTDRISPARTYAAQLQAALTDQETGLRGYLVTADPQFLAPYAAGIDAERTAANQLHTLLAAEPALLASVERAEALGRTWRERYAGPSRLAVEQSGQPVADEATLTRGEVLFDTLRTSLAQLKDQLAAARDAARHDLDLARSRRDATLIVTLAVIVLGGAVLAMLLRRIVLAPLRRLDESTREVTGGNFDHVITPDGPSDVVRLAGAVEAMRQRVVEELSTSVAARRALEQQTTELRRSNAELEQFAYVASHDLQEPLRKVASFCQLLERRYAAQLDDRARQYIDFAVDGARRMQVLINDLLTFSRVGRLQDHRDRVALDHALDHALANLSRLIDEAGATIVRPERLPGVCGDATLLAMLWQNLLGNALKFRAPDRPPVITIEFAEEDEEWRFQVTDNGIGIEPQFSDKVFIIFQRLHGRDAYEGTGIGLALCKKIVEFHGGRIWLDTEHVGGARLGFTLSRQDAAEPAEAPAPALVAAVPTVASTQVSGESPIAVRGPVYE